MLCMKRPSYLHEKSISVIPTIIICNYGTTGVRPSFIHYKEATLFCIVVFYVLHVSIKSRCAFIEHNAFYIMILYMYTP